MTAPMTQARLRIKQSPRRLLRTAGILAAFICAYILAGTTGVIPVPLMWFGIVVFVPALIAGLHNALKATRASWELTLDHHGATVRAHPTTPWTDLAEVRLADARPRWMFALTKRYQFIAFVPRPGITLPSLPSARGHGHGSTSRHSRAREKVYGTQLLLPPSIFDASTDTILTAVENLGNLPTTQD